MCVWICATNINVHACAEVHACLYITLLKKVQIFTPKSKLSHKSNHIYAVLLSTKFICLKIILYESRWRGQKKKNSWEVSPYKNGEEFLVLCNIKEFLKNLAGAMAPYQPM